MISLLGASGVYHGPAGDEAALVVRDRGGSVDLIVFALNDAAEGAPFSVRPALGVIADRYGAGIPLSFTPQPPELSR